MAVILHTNHGDIKIALFPEKAPKTVENFLNYVRSGYYDGTIFHRVINNFMIQGGGFEPGMNQKSVGNPIENEASNGLQNTRYSIAMARTSDPHSATAQFFINVNDNHFLDFPGQDGWGYAVFGEVIEGQNIVDAIEQVETRRSGMHADIPKEDVIIRKATEAKQTPKAAEVKQTPKTAKTKQIPKTAKTKPGTQKTAKAKPGKKKK